MTAVYENKLREDFKSRHEVKEQRLQEEERQKQIELDEVLAIKLQQDEENHRRHQVELEEEKRLWVQQKIKEEN